MCGRISGVRGWPSCVSSRAGGGRGGADRSAVTEPRIGTLRGHGGRPAKTTDAARAAGDSAAAPHI